jgi:hypothetical protein
MTEMTRAKWFAIFGLILNIAGTAMIWEWGAPQPDFNEGIALGLEGPNVDKHAEGAKQLREHYTTMSRVGLGTLGVGFVVQIIATVL